MGNQYSVVREEQEEAEFQRLVRDVEVAHRQQEGDYDLEAGIAQHYAAADLNGGQQHILGGHNPVTGVFQPYAGQFPSDTATHWRHDRQQPGSQDVSLRQHGYPRIARRVPQAPAPASSATCNAVKIEPPSFVPGDDQDSRPPTYVSGARQDGLSVSPSAHNVVFYAADRSPLADASPSTMRRLWIPAEDEGRRTRLPTPNEVVDIPLGQIAPPLTASLSNFSRDVDAAAHAHGARSDTREWHDRCDVDDSSVTSGKSSPVMMPVIVRIPSMGSASPPTIVRRGCFGVSPSHQGGPPFTVGDEMVECAEASNDRSGSPPSTMSHESPIVGSPRQLRPQSYTSQHSLQAPRGRSPSIVDLSRYCRVDGSIVIDRLSAHGRSSSAGRSPSLSSFNAHETERRGSPVVSWSRSVSPPPSRIPVLSLRRKRTERPPRPSNFNVPAIEGSGRCPPASRSPSRHSEQCRFRLSPSLTPPPTAMNHTHPLPVRSEYSRGPSRTRSPVYSLLNVRERERSESPLRVSIPSQLQRGPQPGIFNAESTSPTLEREPDDHTTHRLSRWYRDWIMELEMQGAAREAKLVRLVDRLEQRLFDRGSSAKSNARMSDHSEKHLGHDVDSAVVATTDDEKASLDYAPGNIAKPYPNRAYASGLVPHAKCVGDDWAPVWNVFPLKVFRGPDHSILKISADWDDEMLLRQLRRTYDDLRTVWRKWFSLRNVGSMTTVLADHSFVYPQRVGPAAVSPSKNMRLRWFLHHPEEMRGRHEFMQVLTARTDVGIEFVERWQLSRIAIPILLPVILSLVVGVVYSGLANDPSTGFTIAGYVTSAFSVCLVLVGLLNLVQF